MRRSPWTISVVSVRFAARPAASRCAKEPPPAELAKYVGVYIDVNMYYHTRGTDTTEIVQGLRRIVKALHTYSQDVRNAYGLTGAQLWALKALRSGRMSTG